MFELTVKDEISSAHFLRGYPGKCKDMHGHTWKIEVSLLGEKLNDIGMVTDFAVLKKQFKEFLSALDHTCLNDIEFFKENNPTAENIAAYIFQGFSKVVAPLRIKQVRVWESDRASAIYYE